MNELRFSTHPELNIGGTGKVDVDEDNHKDRLYVGKGAKQITFSSESEDAPAKFYINSCPAHMTYSNTLCTMGEAHMMKLGDEEHTNKRTIYQFIHEDGVQSCQLVMGFTALEKGRIWNTYPPHTHHRRMEVYFYFRTCPQR